MAPPLLYNWGPRLTAPTITTTPSTVDRSPQPPVPLPDDYDYEEDHHKRDTTTTESHSPHSSLQVPGGYSAPNSPKMGGGGGGDVEKRSLNGSIDSGVGLSNPNSDESNPNSDEEDIDDGEESGVNHRGRRTGRKHTTKRETTPSLFSNSNSVSNYGAVADFLDDCDYGYANMYEEGGLGDMVMSIDDISQTVAGLMNERRLTQSPHRQPPQQQPHQQQQSSSQHQNSLHRRPKYLETAARRSLRLATSLEDLTGTKSRGEKSQAYLGTTTAPAIAAGPRSAGAAPSSGSKP
ncbi:hypothetical protein HK102_009044, partial [Quaeritorhiza haematococci]